MPVKKFILLILTTFLFFIPQIVYAGDSPCKVDRLGCTPEYHAHEAYLAKISPFINHTIEALIIGLIGLPIFLYIKGVGRKNIFKVVSILVFLLLIVIFYGIIITY